jgi:predicted RNase H-like nuclease (RuvC/YqgF family)
MSRIQTNYRGNEDFRGGKHDFQAMLRNQIDENSKLKIELSAKIDEIFALKNALEEQQTKQAMLANELDIMKKRQKAEEKNSRIGFDIELQNQRNETDSLRRKL